MKLGTCTEGSVPTALLDKAVSDLSNYVISFCADNLSAGSASLVTLEDVQGFLTAAHVVDELLASQVDRIGIVYSRHPRQLLLDKKILLAAVRYGPRFHCDFPGPDLAFIPIRDADCIHTLKEEKTFYELRDPLASMFEQIKRRFSPVCLIAGAPDERAREEGIRRTPSHRLVNKHFFVRTQLTTETSRDGFHYLKFSSFSGKHGFPADYNGVSGGAVWHIPLRQESPENQASLSFGKPELIGVVFYQSGLVNDVRVIWAHSHRSFIPKFGRRD
jgi:hypothetical protein